MANKKLSAFTTQTSMLNTDLLGFVRTGAPNTNNKITYSNFVAGFAAAAITVVNETTDATCFPVFVTAATGDLGPKTNANFAFDSQNGRLGLGAPTPQARLHAISTGEQLRLGYDDSNYYTTTVDNTGAVTFDATGAGSIFKFKDTVTPTANDGSALGAATVSWSDLYLADGALINFANGNAVIRHRNQEIDVDAVLVVTSTNPQLKVAYDSGTYLQVTVDSAGVTTFDTTGGSSAGFNFSDNIRPSSNGSVFVGSASLGWRGLYLASNGSIDWGNGQTNLAHDGATTLTLAGSLSIVKTTEQLRVGYDVANYYTTTVASNGAVTFDATGSGASFIFSDPLLTVPHDSTFNVGTGTGRVKSSGLLNVVDFSSVSNSGTGETDLQTYTLPANSLSSGKIVEVTFGGVTANNANAKTVRAYVGAQLVQTVTLSALSANRFKGSFRVISAGSNTNNAEVFGCVHGTSVVSAPTRVATNQTESSTIVLKFTGQGGASSDITGEYFDVRFLN